MPRNLPLETQFELVSKLSGELRDDPNRSQIHGKAVWTALIYKANTQNLLLARDFVCIWQYISAVHRRTSHRLLLFDAEFGDVTLGTLDLMGSDFDAPCL